MSDEIEGIDPLTTGNVMYPAPEPSLRLRNRLIEQQDIATSAVPAAPSPAVPNRSKAEQDKAAEGRVEKPLKA